MKELYNRVKRHEGFRARAYDDATGKELKKGDIIQGTVTWGYGFTSIRKEYAARELEDRLLAIHIELSIKINFFIQLPEAIRFVLVEMAYQMGVDGLLKFEKMLRHLRAYLSYHSNPEHLKWAAEEMLDSAWAKQTPARAKELSDIVRNYNKQL